MSSAEIPPTSSKQAIANPPAASVPTVSPPNNKQSLKSWWKGFTKDSNKEVEKPTTGIVMENLEHLPEACEDLAREVHPVYDEFMAWRPSLEALLPNEVEESPTQNGEDGEDGGDGGDGSQAGETTLLSSALPSSTSSTKRLLSRACSFSTSISTALASGGIRARKRASVIFGGRFFVLKEIDTNQASTADSDSTPHKHDSSMESSTATPTSLRISSFRLPPLRIPQSLKHFVADSSYCIKRSSSQLFENAVDKKNALTKLIKGHRGIFEVPLRESIVYANVAISLVDEEGRSYIYGYVPIVVAKCGVFLKEQATNVEGIFRLAGSEKRIKQLRAAFDSPDRYGKGLVWTGYTVHDAANVLRRYLNTMPEPIVPLNLYEKFREPLRGHVQKAVGDTEGLQVDSDFDLEKTIVAYQKLITELPPLNRQLLLYILDLLAVFASKADENRMNAHNLSTIFSPGMLSHPDHDQAPQEYRLNQDVIIFLIENQDNFLIGMRGTAADEKTVQAVQRGSTPPPSSTPTKSKGFLGRSGSSASAGADSVRKFGGVRRNVSVSSRHSRQSNGAPSPATPTNGTPISGGGVHRSNTVPSKKSPGIPQGRLQKQSGSPSPTTGVPVASSQSTAAQGLAIAAAEPSNRAIPMPSPLHAPAQSSLAPSSILAPGQTSKDKLLGEPEALTPSRERPSFFQRSPTTDSERKQPNKLQKKRKPSSSNPSAHSSTHSLQGRSDSVSPAFLPALDTQEKIEPMTLEPILSNDASTPAATSTPRGEYPPPLRPEEYHKSSDSTLKPKGSPRSSLHSRSSVNEQSEVDHADELTSNVGKEKEKRFWRRSRPAQRERDDSQHSNVLSPPRGLGSEYAGASSSSIGSAAHPRKSFTGDSMPIGSEPMMVGTQSSTEGASATGEEKKKGPIGWLKNKMKEREDKEAEKVRTKSPPASTDRIASMPTRAKSIDVKRENDTAAAAHQTPSTPAAPTAQQH